MTPATIALRALALAVLGWVAAFPAPADAQAQKTYTLRFNHVLGPKEPYHQGFLNWAKRVEERTKGGLKIEVFHSAQLGVEEDIIEQMRQGAAVGQNTDSARLGNYVPGIAIMNGPYFVETLEEVAKLRKAPTVIWWQQELAETPFERILSEARLTIVLEGADGATEVALVSKERLRGLARLGSLMVRRATAKRLDEALERLALAVE